MGRGMGEAGDAACCPFSLSRDSQWTAAAAAGAQSKWRRFVFGAPPRAAAVAVQRLEFFFR